MADKTIAQELMDAVRRADAAFAAAQAQAGSDFQRTYEFARIIGTLQGAMKIAVIHGGYDPAALTGGTN
jgi:hypothetical protein